VLFGGVLTVSGMLGMIRVFATNSPGSAVDIVSLLVPQGWAIRGIVGSMHGETVSSLLSTGLVLLAWSVVFFIVGVWRFNRRYV
jgi:ABC-type multidrug transport system permease subunit